MIKEESKLSIGSKIGCFTIIVDDDYYPIKQITDDLEKRNVEKQIAIKQKNMDEKLPQDYKMTDKYLCTCQCGQEYLLSKEILLSKKRR